MGGTGTGPLAPGPWVLQTVIRYDSDGYWDYERIGFQTPTHTNIRAIWFLIDDGVRRGARG